MCGIAGWIDSAAIDPSALDRALAALNRRGPDGSGSWTSPDRRVILGHRRLAILDPSFRGEEPSVAPDGRSAFIHNGEIYNFRALRRELETLGEVFVSESDGEVAHRLLRREGPEAVGRIEGMFALALWSEEGRTLLLARDRIGIKPLYYAPLPGGIAFASEPKALLQLPGISARLDPDALSDFLSYGYVPFDRSIFAGIRKLPPAHRLMYEAGTGRLDVKPFWRLERREVLDDVEELRSRLDEAVTSHLVSDVPVGAFLSGGLDSTTVVSRAAPRCAGPFPTFTVAYGDGNLDDIRYARVAAEAFATAHREEILDVGDVSSTLERAAAIYDEPLYDSTALAVLELSRLSRRSVKVVLTGDGGDEIFGGYGWHETVMRYEALRGKLAFLGPDPFRGSPGGDRTALRNSAGEPVGGIGSASRRRIFPTGIFPVRGFFTAAEQRRVLGRAPEDPAWLFRKFDRPDLPLAQRLLYLDIHTYLPDNNLMLVDRSTMAAGLEARVPLLDRQLLEYAFSLPPERIVRPGATKIAFREAIRPWLPEAILTRSKSGFSPPFKRWVGGEARQTALRILEESDLAADGVIDPRGVRVLVESGTQRRHSKLWMLLNLEAWYRRWIRGRIAQPSSEAAAAPA